MVVPRGSRIQCLVVGDSGFGKTTMLLHYATNRFPSCHGLKVFDNYAGVLKVGTQNYCLQLLDTTEHPDIEERRQSCPRTDVIIICFSVINPDSFENEQTKWIPELQNALGGTPVIIIGTHGDLRQDPNVLREPQLKGQKPVILAKGKTDREKQKRKLDVAASEETEAQPEQKPRKKNTSW